MHVDEDARLFTNGDARVGVTDDSRTDQENFTYQPQSAPLTSETCQSQLGIQVLK